MPATRSDILRWLQRAKDEGARWMVVKCDDFDFRGDPGDPCCYPVFHTNPERVWETIENNDRTMEVYDLEASIDSQMAEHRAMHPPAKPVKENV